MERLFIFLFGHQLCSQILGLPNFQVIRAAQRLQPHLPDKCKGCLFSTMFYGLMLDRLLPWGSGYQGGQCVPFFANLSLWLCLDLAKRWRWWRSCRDHKSPHRVKAAELSYHTALAHRPPLPLFRRPFVREIVLNRPSLYGIGAFHPQECFAPSWSIRQHGHAKVDLRELVRKSEESYVDFQQACLTHRQCCRTSALFARESGEHLRHARVWLHGSTPEREGQTKNSEKPEKRTSKLRLKPKLKPEKKNNKQNTKKIPKKKKPKKETPILRVQVPPEKGFNR